MGEIPAGPLVLRSGDGRPAAAAVLIPLSPIGEVLGFTAPPPAFWFLLVVLVAAYLALVELVKRRFEPPRSSPP
jgi:hypothetical protein